MGQLAGVIQQLLRSKQEVPNGPADSAQEIDSNELGLGIKEIAGKEFFAETIAQGHEGVVAKHVSGRYRPGQRSAGWRKIKPVHVIPCVVIGYTPGPDGFHSLLVGAEREGTLRYVGELTCGFTASAKAEGAAGLQQRQRAKPIVACPKRAQWVEPEWYCQVKFLEWTAHDRLHGASFQRWIAPRGILAPLATGRAASAR